MESPGENVWFSLDKDRLRSSGHKVANDPSHTAARERQTIFVRKIRYTLRCYTVRMQTSERKRCIMIHVTRQPASTVSTLLSSWIGCRRCSMSGWRNMAGYTPFTRSTPTSAIWQVGHHPLLLPYLTPVRAARRHPESPGGGQSVRQRRRWYCIYSRPRYAPSSVPSSPSGSPSSRYPGLSERMR